MAIGGITSNLNGASGSSGLGPKVQESNLGVFDRLLHQLQKSIGTDRASGSSSQNSAGSVNDLRLETSHFKTDFQRKLIQQLLQQGVDLSQPFTLKSDGFGGVQVAGSHPDKATIEQLFEENSDLRQEFSQLAGQAEKLFVADRTSFTEGTTPGNGIGDLTQVNTRPTFNLIVRDGATEMAFLKDE